MINSDFKYQKRVILTLFIIYLLNCTDIIFTLTLLKTGCIYEANPLMQPFINSTTLSLFIKILLPGFSFIYIFNKLLQTNVIQSSLINFISLFSLCIYILINVYHIYLIISIMF